MPEQAKPKDYDAEMRNAPGMQKQFTRKLEKEMFGVDPGDKATPVLMPKKSKNMKTKTMPKKSKTMNPKAKVRKKIVPI